MSPLGRILCAVDLEKASERAFDRALSLAVIGRAKLFVLHVVPKDVRYSSRAAERLQYLTELKERAKTAGVEVRVEEQQGDPVRVIVLHANARKVDIVVLGSNGRRGWRRLKEGSVAETVLRRAAWPVLIVPWDAGTGVLGEKQTRPSEVLHLEEVPLPNAGDGDVLVRVQAASANAGDSHLLRGTPLPFRLVAGLRKPKFKIIGNDIAGRVEAAGRNVTQFRPGDHVFGELSRCGFGAYAEFAVAPEKALALKPANLSFEEAAAIPTAGCTALQGLRKGRIEQARRVLINGASGGVGTFAVQIAKTFGSEVTAVCSTTNIDMVRSIGADYVLDYTKDDFAALGQRYDLILAVNGDRSIWDYKRALSADGTYTMTAGTNRQLTDALLFGPVLSMGRQKLGNLLMKPNQADLLFLKELCEAGKFRPMIDRRFPLSEVPAAVRYVEDGRARGKVVITV